MARNISRYEPMSELMRSGFFPDVGNLFREFALSPLGRNMEMEPRMKIDVEESDNNYVVTAEIPGVNKDDISVDITGSTVSIKAEMKEEKKEEGSNTLHTERYYGTQMRSFTLPQEVDEGKAQATYENGLLCLTLPKKQASGSKKLTIQ